MNKKDIFTFRGLNQDISKSKHSKELYYEGNNIRLSATDSQSTGSVANEKGNELVFSIPTPSLVTASSLIVYGNDSLEYSGTNNEITNTYSGKTSEQQVIIGHTTSRDGIVLFTTDSKGFDCIWEVVDNKLSLLYMRDLGFSKDQPIQAIFNYENKRVQKVYWVDGLNQLRFINIKHSKKNDFTEELIDVNSNTINIVGNFDITQPKITGLSSGGTHTSGMIQYTYNLYRLNSSQTKLAPLSKLVPLDKGTGKGGGEVNEIVGTTPVVEMNGLDSEYTHIRVYAVKYTSYNQTPTISLIKDQTIGANRAVTIFDDGNVINDLSISEFLFLGSDPIIPKHIEAKDNILFSANIREKNFDVKLDTRAYSFNNAGVARVWDNTKLSSSGLPVGDVYSILSPSYILGKTIDAVNIDYDKYLYQADQITRGGEGKHIKYELKQDNTVIDPEEKKFFKDSEVYRLGIQFYNRLGQKSLPKWIADFKAPEGNLEGNYNTLKVTLKSDFYVWLNTSSNFNSEDEKPVGYRVLRANRTLNDRTILTQGFLNGMVSNYRATDKSNDLSAQARTRAAQGNKLPSLQRVFGKYAEQMEGAKHTLKLDNFDSADDRREVHKASASENWIAETFQFNTLMQMFSPEILFSNMAFYEGLELRVKGANRAVQNKFWGQSRKVSTKEIIREGKVLNGLSPHDNISFPNTQETPIQGDINNMCDYGIFGPAARDSSGEMDMYQFYRDFTGGYISGSNRTYPIYGKPELTEKGQMSTNYNSDPKLNYYNSLQPMIADGGDGSGENSPAISSVNSWGASCATLALGPNDKTYDVHRRPKIEDLWSNSFVGEDNVMLVAEFVKNKEQIYLGGIYGGNSFEDKKRTNYIEIGSYVPITTDNIYIDSPGDTFVQNFKFTKLAKTDTEIYSAASLQISEIVEGRIESSIDLGNRNDISNTEWDSRFQPREDEYHKYNRVYSQQPTLIENRDVDYTFTEVQDFDTRIMASKVKVPGENIDGWTDLLVNEVQDLNGKNGPINSLVSFRDNIYALQDNAIAAIGINPRVQVQGSDGVDIELGSGRVLHDYKYITTNSGTLNKWGVVSTQYAIYYLDTINKCFNRFSNKIEKLSDTKGLHSWFQNNMEYDKVKLDNPILGTGVSVGYDLINNSVYLTLHQDTSYTRLFDEAADTFVGLMDYKPSRYISDNSKLYMTKDNNSIYEHFKGKYNHFFGEYFPSYITLLVNPASNYHCVFNNVEFNSELYLNNVDQFDKTLTHIQAYNEYQDSGRTPLVLGRNSNLRRKFRTWRADIPRDGRERIRNPWTYLKLELDNNSNYKFILHDIIVDYSVG